MVANGNCFLGRCLSTHELFNFFSVCDFAQRLVGELISSRSREKVFKSQVIHVLGYSSHRGRLLSISETLDAIPLELLNTVKGFHKLNKS